MRTTTAIKYNGICTLSMVKVLNKLRKVNMVYGTFAIYFSLISDKITDIIDLIEI